MDSLTAVLPGAVSGFIVSYAGYRLTARASLSSTKQSIRREAAADLSATIRDLRSMSRRWGRVELTQEEVCSAIVAWSEAFDRQSHRLPTRWKHLGHSVRAAAGEVFGGVVLADLRPDMATYPLAEPNYKWQDFADDYLTYILNAVVRWGDGDSSMKDLRSFDSWLQVTDRHSWSTH